MLVKKVRPSQSCEVTGQTSECYYLFYAKHGMSRKRVTQAQHGWVVVS